MSQQTGLRVHSVNCVDETNDAWAERSGSDEVRAGGYRDSSQGDNQFIGPWAVYANFDDGDVKAHRAASCPSRLRTGASGLPARAGAESCAGGEGLRRHDRRHQGHRQIGERAAQGRAGAATAGELVPAPTPEF